LPIVTKKKTIYLTSIFQIINELKSQLITDHIHVQMDSHGPDLSDLLRDIRAQYDLAAKRNREESEEWYSSKVGKTFYSMFS